MSHNKDIKRRAARELSDDYEVGYRKPPKATQFKKGHSGNRKGRPKGSKNFSTYVDYALSCKVSVKEDGKVRKITVLEATLARLSQKALEGDIRAIKTVLDYAQSLEDDGSMARPLIVHIAEPESGLG